MCWLHYLLLGYGFSVLYIIFLCNQVIGFVSFPDGVWRGRDWRVLVQDKERSVSSMVKNYTAQREKIKTHICTERHPLGVVGTLHSTIYTDMQNSLGCLGLWEKNTRSTAFMSTHEQFPQSMFSDLRGIGSQLNIAIWCKEATQVTVYYAANFKGRDSESTF